MGKVTEEVEEKAKKKKRKVEEPVTEALAEEEEPEPKPKKKKKAEAEHAEKPAATPAPKKKMSLKEKKRAKKALEKGESPATEIAASKVAEGFQVLVTGLPFSAKEADLRELFAACGTILEVAVLGRRLGKATLTFADEQGLKSALGKDGKMHKDRWIAVSAKGKGKGSSQNEKAKEKGKGKNEGKGKSAGKGEVRDYEVFAFGFPLSVGEARLRKVFAQCGSIDRFIMPVEKDGTQKGLAFISFTTLEEMEKALELDKTEFSGLELRVQKRVDPKKTGKSKGSQKGKLGCRDFEVFLGGLPFATEESVIRRDFEECGEIIRFSMPQDDEGNHKGLAFISYGSSEAMEKALAFHETSYGGVTIRVQRANAPRGSNFERSKGQSKASAEDGKAGKGQEWVDRFGGTHSNFANSQGVIVESQGKRQTFDESEDED